MAEVDTQLMEEGRRIAAESREVFSARVHSTGMCEVTVEPAFVPFAANTLANIARSAAHLAAPGPLREWLNRVAEDAAEMQASPCPPATG
jgi:hypothetical protein